MAPRPAFETWFPFRRPNPAAQVRLVCVPFAGGGASMFRGWAEGLPRTVDVCAVQPPGRETRFGESACVGLNDLAAGLSDALEPLLDMPIVLYGHSMGALVAFELARTMRRRNLPSPARLIVSGRVAPDESTGRPLLHGLPDREFRAELKQLNGTPAAVIDNDEIMQAFLPVLRADFTAYENYEFAPAPPLECPILAITGIADTLAPPVLLNGWRRHTAAAFESRVLTGDHFFLQSHRPALLRLLTRYLEPTC